jgi:fatty-acyl-CoA synthase
VFFGRRISYREMADTAERLAAHMHAQGVRKGDRVILLMQNMAQLVIGHFAIQRANAVVVPVNPMNLAEELKHYITDGGVKWPSPRPIWRPSWPRPAMHWRPLTACRTWWLPSSTTTCPKARPANPCPKPGKPGSSPPRPACAGRRQRQQLEGRGRDHGPVPALEVGPDD